MNGLKWKLAALASAVVLAACGGGEGKPQFTTLVSFGDSLSDVGTYRVGTIAAVGGGEFTVNGSNPNTWTEFLAADLGANAPCAAQTGLLSNIPGLTGAAVTNNVNCRNYAQGSARVTNPIGPNSAALQQAPFNEINLGLMAVPVATQMATHLTVAGGAYTGNELVTVMAGGNDIFMNAGAVGMAAGGGATAVGAAIAAGWSTTVQGAVAAGGAAAVNAAATAAVQGMGQAGAELALLVRNQVLGKGARFVVVVNLPDVSQTPYALSQSAETRALINNMVTTFNAQLAAGLSGSPALLVDAYTRGRDQTANPGAYGLTNVTGMACDPASPTNPLQGSSLACTAAGTVANSSAYLYADSVHPTPKGHQLITQGVKERMVTVGWY